MENLRLRALIYGDVTGVGFRAWTMRNAKSLRLNGWVRNADAGCVEAVFEGPKEKIMEMLEICRKGPEISWVKKVDEIWEEKTDNYKDFTVRF